MYSVWDCKGMFYYSILGQCIVYDNIYILCIMIVVIEQFMCVWIIKFKYYIFACIHVN